MILILMTLMVWRSLQIPIIRNCLPLVTLGTFTFPRSETETSLAKDHPECIDDHHSAHHFAFCKIPRSVYDVLK